jgi:hypothetical protein
MKYTVTIFFFLKPKITPKQRLLESVSQDVYSWTASVSAFSILWCCHTGEHPQENLATFGYTLAMRAEIY